MPSTSVINRRAARVPVDEILPTIVALLDRLASGVTPDELPSLADTQRAFHLAARFYGRVQGVSLLAFDFEAARAGAAFRPAPTALTQECLASVTSRDYFREGAGEILTEEPAAHREIRAQVLAASAGIAPPARAEARPDLADLLAAAFAAE